MRGLSHPAWEKIELAAVMHALADPARLQIVGRLATAGELGCSPEACGVALHKSTLSHHFRVLREAGLIHVRQSGRTRLTKLRQEDLDRRFPGLLDSVLQAISVSFGPSPLDAATGLSVRRNGAAPKIKPRLASS
ncbi:MAG TPA: metalloregulator ArsR/SmtB family transcription factor [Streptosporangiaceae bacterium]|jgi:DNA-binding transcriptional ArsR family regulator